MDRWQARPPPSWSTRMKAAILAAALTVVVLACRERAGNSASGPTRNGARKAATCPIAQEYGEVTLIPAECRVHRQGALYTLGLDARVDADLVELGRHRELLPKWREAVSLRDSRIAKLETALEQAADDLADAGERLHIAEQRANAAARMAADEAAAFKLGRCCGRRGRRCDGRGRRPDCGDASIGED